MWLSSRISVKVDATNLLTNSSANLPHTIHKLLIPLRAFILHFRPHKPLPHKHTPKSTYPVITFFKLEFLRLVDLDLLVHVHAYVFGVHE